MPKPPVKARDASDPQHVRKSVFSCGARARGSRAAQPRRPGEPRWQGRAALATGQGRTPAARRRQARLRLSAWTASTHTAQHGKLWRARHDGEGAGAAEAAALRRAHPPHQRDPADHGDGDGLRTRAPRGLLSWTGAGTCGRARARAERTMPGIMPADSDSFRMMTVNGSPTTSDQPNMRSVSCSCHGGSSRQPSPVCRARGRRQAHAQGPARAQARGAAGRRRGLQRLQCNPRAAAPSHAGLPHGRRKLQGQNKTELAKALGTQGEPRKHPGAALAQAVQRCSGRPAGRRSAWLSERARAVAGAPTVCRTPRRRAPAAAAWPPAAAC